MRLRAATLPTTIQRQAARLRVRGAVAPVGHGVSLADKVHPDVAAAIQLLQSQVDALTSHANQVKQAGYLTRMEAEACYSPRVMARELSANGSAPLNVSNLLGILSQIQP